MVIPWGKNAKLEGGAHGENCTEKTRSSTLIFFDAKKVLVYVHSVACDWFQSKYQNVKSHTNKITQVTSHKCFGSALYYDCVSSKVDVSMSKTWISPTANSSYNPLSTLKLDYMASSASSNSATSFSSSSRVALS